MRTFKSVRRFSTRDSHKFRNLDPEGVILKTKREAARDLISTMPEEYLNSLFKFETRPIKGIYLNHEVVASARVERFEEDYQL